MVIFRKIRPLKAFLHDKRLQDIPIGLVPTMGALHQGHLELAKASKKGNSITVCSIFVNPTQFNNSSDLAKYPRTEKQDIANLESVGCDVLFHPEREEMYQKPSTLKFDFGKLDKVLEGEFRPGHFSGVALVVSKLFNIVNPTRAFWTKRFSAVQNHKSASWRTRLQYWIDLFSNLAGIWRFGHVLTQS